MSSRKLMLTFSALILTFTGTARGASLAEDFLMDPLAFFNNNFAALTDVPQPDLTQEEKEELAEVPDEVANSFGLDTCAYIAGVDEPWLERLSSTALYRENVYKQLKAAGYPKDVWLAKLHAVVVAEIKEIARLLKNGAQVPSGGRLEGIYPLEVDLYNSVVDYANSFEGSIQYPSVIVDWCGGDFIGYVRVQSEPPNASIKLMSEFSFRLCQSQGKNPYAESCVDWMEISPDNGIPAGLYRYHAKWPDGLATCNLKDLTPSQGWQEPDEEPVVTILRSSSPCPN